MVEVFRTDVADVTHAGMLLMLIRKQWPQYLVNFDLEDCDRILRVEGNSIEQQQVISLMQSQGCFCELLC